MEEILDLVDESDEIIGEVLKSVANSHPSKIHREILVCIFDDKNRMLMQQRSFKKKVYPGYWAESCAGHVAKGENPEESAHRELMEELGFDTPLTFMEKRLLRFLNETHFAYCFLGKYNGEEIIIQKDEIEEVKFVEKADLEKVVKMDDEVTRNEVKWMKKIWLVN